MATNDFVPVIAAVVGGMLTILGGLAASFMILRSSRKSEKRAVFRSGLEKMYMICTSLQNDIDYSTFKAAQLAEVQKEEMNALRLVHRPTREINNTATFCGKLSFLTFSYFPKLEPSIVSLDIAINKFKYAEYLYYLEANRTNMKPSSEQYNSLQLPAKTVIDECRKVRTQIEKEIKRFI